MTKPLLSIVVANYNYGRFLEEAIKSVIKQGVGDKAELIVCDAASSDNSVEIIKKYANGLPPNTSIYDWKPKTDDQSPTTKVTWWCSEKDGGQSAAFNKGFSHARGEWITWLNSDDLYLPGTLKAFAKLVQQKSNAEWVTGNMLSFDSNTRKIIRVNWGPHHEPHWLKKAHAFNAVFGPSTFWKKSLYDRVGGIDEKLHYAMDTEYWARLTMAGIRPIRLHHLCWAFRVHEDSKTVGVQSPEVTEKRQRETAYWQKKTGYKFEPRLSNVYYLLWCFCRLLDGSWIVRAWLKWSYEGRLLNEKVD